MPIVVVHPLTVVTVQFCEAVPMVTVAVSVVPVIELLVIRTFSVLVPSGVKTPLVVHAPPLMLTCGLPLAPETVTASEVLHPVGVIAPLLWMVLTVALETLVKENPPVGAVHPVPVLAARNCHVLPVQNSI